MTYGFYFCVCFGFILLQTTIFPLLPPFGRFFDLIIPFVVYLGLKRPGKENLPIIIILGVIADNLLEIGFTRVYVLHGGLESWKVHGLPTGKGD